MGIRGISRPQSNGSANGASNGAETPADGEVAGDIIYENSVPASAEAIQETLVEHLRDLLHAEKQLVKALPKMARAAQSLQLREAFELHLTETEEQVERLNEILTMLEAGNTRLKPCKGMMGLIEEGEEIMAEGKKKDPYLADLELIAAAHKVEHYEIASYITARNLAFQLRMPDVSRLLQMSLAEEQNSDMLLDQIGRPLSSVLGRPAAVV